MNRISYITVRMILGAVTVTDVRILKNPPAPMAEMIDIIVIVSIEVPYKSSYQNP